MPLFSSALNPEQRKQTLKKLATEEFDVLVVGGGVNGCGIALDAASRGLTVALVEYQDLAAGTSSRSSKLIHGGLRYLEQYDFKLVREALHERELMVKTLAPHLVRQVGFLYPLTEKWRERTYVGAGMVLYDALRGFNRALPWHKYINRAEIGKLAPSLHHDSIAAGFQYFDAQVDDARHTMMIARTAAQYGAQIATGVKCESVTRNGKRVIGAKVRDLETGEIISVKARATIMAAGVWTDELYESFDIKAGYEVQMSKGVHIVLPKSCINSNTGIILKTEVSVLFIIPWGEFWIVGTTDTAYHGDPTEPLASDEDIDYILAQANRVLQPQISRREIIGVFAGLRPLISSKKGSPTTKLSREHVVDSPVSGFVSIAGGKYTTYRIMAKDAVDAATPSIRKKVAESCTESIPIIGADGFFALQNLVPQICEKYQLSSHEVELLLERYGSLIDDVLAPIEKTKALAQPLSKEIPYLAAEILYAVTHEGARSVEDVLARRTRIAFEAHDGGASIAEAVAKLIGPTLEWSLSQRRASVKEYLEVLGKIRGSLSA